MNRIEHSWNQIGKVPEAYLRVDFRLTQNGNEPLYSVREVTGKEAPGNRKCDTVTGIDFYFEQGQVWKIESGLLKWRRNELAPR
jgi:hypothetical protein